MDENVEKNKSSRRKFLKLGLGAGVTSVIAATGVNLLTANKAMAIGGERIKVLTQDGKLVEVNKADLVPSEKVISREESHYGIPNRKFVMVIDLAKCKNARKCVDACQVGHQLPKEHEWMKVFLMQDVDKTAPYWMPRPCFHCDNPLCVSVCPVGATYKRTDGIVLVDNDRCIGCKFCMTACPFSARQFHWKEPETYTISEDKYSPETNMPGKEGTVGKCVFCPDRLREGLLPRCASACPMGVIYFGDIIEDTVTNGEETLRFSELIRDRAGYRQFEELGTEPSVFYLPPTNRQFPVERGLDGYDPEIVDRYKEVPYVKNLKTNENGK
ncbi:MAG: 4Fe-4S dicluster domain-containing protein [Bacteroidales bacterium]